MPSHPRLRAFFCLCVLAGCTDHPTDPFSPPVYRVVVSSDSAVVDPGDTLTLRAQVQDTNLVVLPHPAEWSSSNPSILEFVRAGNTGKFVAHAAGLAHAIARYETAADTTAVRVRPPLTSTTIQPRLDTINALEALDTLTIASSGPEGARLGRYTVTTRDTLVAKVVRTERETIEVRSRSIAGATWLVVTEQNGSSDSSRVVVHQVEDNLGVPNELYGVVGKTITLRPTIRDRTGHDVAGLSLDWTSLDHAIATVDNGEVSFLESGTAQIVVVSPAGLADTAFVVAHLPERLDFLPDTVRVGGGVLSAIFPVNAPGQYAPASIELDILDDAIAGVPATILNDGNGLLRIAGRTAGVTRLVMTATDRLPDTSVVVVSSPRVRLAGEFNAQVGGGALLRVFLAGHLGEAGAPAEPVTVTFALRATSIAAVTGPVTLDPPDSPSGPIPTPRIGLVGLAAGSTWLLATAPGFEADSVRVTVTPGPSLRFRGNHTRLYGLGQRDQEFEPDPSAVLTTTDPEFTRTSNLPLTFTRTNPSVANIQFPSQLASTAVSVNVPVIEALATGTDTIVATAPGYSPDTLVVVVTTPRLLVAPSLVVRTRGYLIFEPGDSLGRRHAMAGDRKFTLLSSNPAVVPSTYVVGPGPGLAAELRPEGIGAATITVMDSTGLYQPRDVAVTVVLDSTLRTFPRGDYTGYLPGPPAPGQVFDGVTTRVLVDLNLPARPATLTPTVAGVLSVPSSVQTGETFPIIAGPTPGEARIVGSATGFKPDTSALLTVRPGRLHAGNLTEAWVGVPYVLYAAALNIRGNGLPQAANATFTLTAPDGGITVPPQITIDAGQGTEQYTATFTEPGDRRLVLSDLRPVPSPYAPSTITVRSRIPPLALKKTRVGSGQYGLAEVWRPFDTRLTGVTVSITARGGHSRFSKGSITMAPHQEVVLAEIEGLSVGIDTVIVSAPGYDADTAIVEVTEGTVIPTPWPEAVRTGDSVQVRLLIGDAGREPHTAAVNTAFTFLVEGGLSFSYESRPINSISIMAGYDSTPFFFMKYTGTNRATVRFFSLQYLEEEWEVSPP